jgi:isocitrate dehydrogenase (NAD+)
LWDEQEIDVAGTPPKQSPVSDDALTSVRRNGFGLKGPMATPVGKGHRSLNLTLRKVLGLYANIRPAVSMPGVKTRHENVDVVTVRQNTEGEYSGPEHVVVDGVVESLKFITRAASKRVCEYAFEYALRNNRKKVTAVHKASVMRMSDGLFLECAENLVQRYAGKLEFDTLLIDKRRLLPRH